MNPCPCGFRGSRSSDCRCDDAAVAKYVAKLSGPLLDRIDLHVEVARVAFEEMLARQSAEPSSRHSQPRRSGTGRSVAALRRYAGPHERRGRRQTTYAATVRSVPMRPRLLRAASARNQFSARALDRIARVARTIADLAHADEIAAAHVAEAIAYRSLERRGLAA